MALASTDFEEKLVDNNARLASMHPLRPVMVTVFAAKLAVAAVLLGCASFAPNVAADTSYFVQR